MAGEIFSAIPGGAKNVTGGARRIGLCRRCLQFFPSTSASVYMTSQRR